MEKLDHPSHPYKQIRLSPTKYMSGAETLGGPGAKSEQGFINSSNPPVHDQSLLARKGTSTENIFFKGLQGDGPPQTGRPKYLQPTLGNGGWEGSQAEEVPASRVSIAGRTSIGPVWQVPDKKNQSSPPPLPPLRSDSFAATKVFPYTEGPNGPTKTQGRSSEKNAENINQNSLKSQKEKPSEVRHSFTPLPTKEFLHPNTAADHNHNQLHPNKLFSLSSTDVRHTPYTHEPAHQRQYSDESPFYLQTRSAHATRAQSVGSYYRSLQDLPTNLLSRMQIRNSTVSAVSLAANPTNLDRRGHSRLIGPTSQNSGQTTELQARQGKNDSWRAETGKTLWANNSEPSYSSSLMGNIATKYSLPQSQMPYSETKEGNCQSLFGNGLYYEHQTSGLSNHSRSPDDASSRVEGQSSDKDRRFATQISNDHKVSLHTQLDPWVPQEDYRISPQKTPLLHSLAQESRSLTERQQAMMTSSVTSTQDSGDMSSNVGKMNRRSDRYATTLRKEIQQKRAQLQKSRSAATLTCNVEEEEEGEEWRSTGTSASTSAPFSNTYKDHLKEAQARVLQATSFQRRDLGPEAPAVKTSSGRIRGRKRFTLAKGTHSFSEPDKIDKVGVEKDPITGSFGEQPEFLEVKPAFSKPTLKTSQATNSNLDLSELSKHKERDSSVKPDETNPSTDPTNNPTLDHNQTVEQQRLGTFAEYQATWNKQKKSPEARIQGRYHSAENILDADPEEKAVCIHEKSRSSPSADFYTQNLSLTWTESEAQSSNTTRAKSENIVGFKPDHIPQSNPSDPRNKDLVPGSSDHGPKLSTADPSQTTPSSGPGSLSPSLGSQLLQTKGLLPPPRSHLGPETTSSSQEFPTGAQVDQAELLPLSDSCTDTQRSSASPAPANSPRLSRTSAQDVSGRDVETEQERQQQPLLPPPPPPPQLSSSSCMIPTADGTRSPSPQFAPLRLTDKPPAVSVQDDSPLSSENGPNAVEVMDLNSPGRKVPVKIIHTDSTFDRVGQAYLFQSNETCSTFKPLPLNPSVGASEHQVSSSFSAYTRPVIQDPGSASTRAQDPKTAQHTEDAKREELARDIMGKDKSLVDILDQSGRKTTMDLMEGLYPSEDHILEGTHQRRRASTSGRLPVSSPRSMERREDEEELTASAASSLVPSSSYYNTSAPKAELLIKMKDMQGQLEEQDSEDELDVDLASKKQELISSLAKKLDVLREARQSLQEDMEDNETLGREVEATVQRLCQPKQLEKFRMFVGDLDKVVSLLLSLSGRLARVENALNSLEEDASPEEKRTLTEKRKLLMRQHEDAKELKENLDRRESLVSGIMEVHLDDGSLDDYRHFVKMKSALIIEQRKLEDKIKLGEEQLKCLLDSLPLEQRSLF
ncbi:protein Shroom2 isoform X3 [Cynoglossus semilaevis]|nr:protein Shroom2-like isoform X3 [Cynoglossus semilaevis]XP_024918309.1 protein Shroom2-like isoform X3 [Cynoglossus semilaevis]